MVEAHSCVNPQTIATIHTCFPSDKWHLHEQHIDYTTYSDVIHGSLTLITATNAKYTTSASYAGLITPPLQPVTM